MSGPNILCMACGIVMVATVLAVAFYRLVCRNNRRRNSAVDEGHDTTTRNRIINDQYAATGHRFAYGLYAARRNACEVIAVHNAKVLLGRESTLSQTAADFQSAGAMIGYGLLGSSPRAIGRVLRRSGMDYERIGLADMTRQGIYILSFWNRRRPWGGLHTVAVRYDGRNYTTYNLKGRGRVSAMPPSLYARHFICGYYLT